MNETMNWMQNNWYELGSLTGQFAFLFAGLWFAVKILRTMRATQQQMGALLRLSMTDGLEDRSKINDAADEINDTAHEPAPSVVAGSMFSPAMERPTPSTSSPRTAPARSSAPYTAFEKPARGEAPSFSDGPSARAETSATSAATATIEPTYEPTPFAAAPLTLPEDEHQGSSIAAAGRGVAQWLQTPIANKRKGGNPLKKVVRWLQEPAR